MSTGRRRPVGSGSSPACCAPRRVRCSSRRSGSSTAAPPRSSPRTPRRRRSPHPFGTDTLGRDLLARTASGAWLSLLDLGAARRARLSSPCRSAAGRLPPRSPDRHRHHPGVGGVPGGPELRARGVPARSPPDRRPARRAGGSITSAASPSASRSSSSPSSPRHAGGDDRRDAARLRRRPARHSACRREILAREVLVNVAPAIGVQALLALADRDLRRRRAQLPRPRCRRHRRRRWATSSPTPEPEPAQRTRGGTRSIPGLVMVIGILGCNLVGDALHDTAVTGVEPPRRWRHDRPGTGAVQPPTLPRSRRRRRLALRRCSSPAAGRRSERSASAASSSVTATASSASASAAAPGNINPLDSGSEVTRWIAEPVVETLYAYDENLQSVPLLAAGEPEVRRRPRLDHPPPRRRPLHNGDPLDRRRRGRHARPHRQLLPPGSEWITYLIGYVQRFDGRRPHGRIELVVALRAAALAPHQPADLPPRLRRPQATR